MNRLYQNPIARHGDYADPFVLRYNGTYYLYATNPDLRVFTSQNLLDWKEAGPAIDPDTFPGLVPFAPEVVYWNGWFYMYTSPSGFGHYILRSDSPTGPFEKISGNEGHDIDGSVFIDDDGTWYFYWAGDEGIWGCRMDSPTKFQEPVLTGAYLHGWTEGPMILKRDGFYYMTYTGNHYLSKGYRIHAASSRHPLTGYKDEPGGPIAVHTQDGPVGLGHSSTVLGPDLVSYYMVYHNLNGDASRDLNIDRMMWYQANTQLMGPTRTPQEAPGLPDASDPAPEGSAALSWEFERGKWEEKNGVRYTLQNELCVKTVENFGPSYTAEFHLSIPCPDAGPDDSSRSEREANISCMKKAGNSENGQNQSVAGIVLDAGEKKYYLVFRINRHALQIWSGLPEQTVLLGESQLPEAYDFNSLHNIRVQSDKGRMKIWIDNRLQIADVAVQKEKVRPGYFAAGTRVGCGYTAVTNNTYDNEISNTVIPAGCSCAAVYGAVNTSADENGAVQIGRGDIMKYRFRTEGEGNYRLNVICRPSESSSGFLVTADKEPICTGSGEEILQSFPVALSAGLHRFTITGQAGTAELARIELVRQGAAAEYESDTVVEVGPYGKALCGDTQWHDYTAEAEFTADIGEEGSAGIMLRVTEPAEGGEGEDPVLGIDFFLGYTVSVSDGWLRIARHRYDREILAECPLEVKNDGYTLSVTVTGAYIDVYMNQELTPRLRVCDKQPLTHGCAGVWAKNSKIKVTGLRISERRRV